MQVKAVKSRAQKVVFFMAYDCSVGFNQHLVAVQARRTRELALKCLIISFCKSTYFFWNSKKKNGLFNQFLDKCCLIMGL
jgi:hypothetical protein